MNEEREFIRGNRDGPKGWNETYTVCRLRVSKERLNGELELGLHSHFVSVSPCWKCPAHIFLKAERKAAQKSEGQYEAPPVISLERWKAADLGSTPGETLEIIQRDPDRAAGEGATYTICRISVPRVRMFREVAAGLHPRYHVRLGSRGRYVQGNPSDPFDNVNFPGSCKPGLGTRHLCPFRLLRPGVSLENFARC